MRILLVAAAFLATVSAPSFAQNDSAPSLHQTYPGGWCTTIIKNGKQFRTCFKS